MSDVKECKLCGEVKPLTSEYWHKESKTKDGFKGTCKECRCLWKRKRLKLKNTLKELGIEDSEKVQSRRLLQGYF